MCVSSHLPGNSLQCCSRQLVPMLSCSDMSASLQMCCSETQKKYKHKKFLNERFRRWHFLLLKGSLRFLPCSSPCFRIREKLICARTHLLLPTQCLPPPAARVTVPCNYVFCSYFSRDLITERLVAQYPTHTTVLIHTIIFTPFPSQLY